MSPQAPRRLHCPTCGKPVEWSDAFPHRPFCSERCRLIDLGQWAAERYRIPGDGDEPPPRSGDPRDEEP
ncbi:MAG: hypothetical protein KatS3mg124_1610 [Porticoccaceae bacterium]|nr:MAG: hypothetical protein KatS3mg124_1610 [Porticoccaceae bacterium]